VVPTKMSAGYGKDGSGKVILDLSLREFGDILSAVPCHIPFGGACKGGIEIPAWLPPEAFPGL
jgi:hypothetical protein